MADASLNKLQLYLKIGLLLISAVITVSCLAGSIAYDWWSSRITEKIIDFQTHNPTLSDPKLTAATDLMKQGQETAHQHGVTLFELFTHVLTGFLGIAITALADVVGARVGTDTTIPSVPAQEDPAK